MDQKQQNLTNPLEIRHALEDILGVGAIQKIAALHDVKSSIVSNAIYGRRRSKRDIKILACIAWVIQKPVRGVLPDGTELEGW